LEGNLDASHIAEPLTTNLKVSIYTSKPRGEVLEARKNNLATTIRGRKQKMYSLSHT
jgi:hypothetical protein